MVRIASRGRGSTISVTGNRSRMIRDSVRAGYDFRAPEFGLSPPRQHDPNRVALPEIHPGAVVLDVGCGTGQLAASIVTTCQASLFVGLDLSAAMLRRAVTEQASSKETAWTQGDAERLPYACEHFDVVISRRVLSHLPDPCDAFREIARVVRPGGAIDITMIGDRGMGRPIERLLRSTVREVVGTRAEALISLFVPPTISMVDAAAHTAGLEPTSLNATTVYTWGEPDSLAIRLLDAVAYMRPHLSEVELADIAERLLHVARVTAGPRGLEDWSYEISYKGTKPTP